MRKLIESHMIRLSGVLLADEKILLIEQNVGDRKWYLPGGKLEQDETLEQGIIREMCEETGAKTEVERMLCISDTDFENPAAIHILFLLKLCGGEIGVQKEFQETIPITNVKFVPVDALVEYGFSKEFMKACKNRFANVPAYVGKDTFLDLLNI